MNSVPQASPDVNPVDITKQFAKLLAHLWQGAGAAYFWTVDGSTKNKASYWFDLADGIPAVPRFHNQHVYFGVHAAAAKKSKSERLFNTDISVINCVFAEFDAYEIAGVSEPGKFADTRAILDHLDKLLDEGIPYPSALICSGGNHPQSGLQAIWQLSNPVLVTDANRDHVREVQKAWVALVGSDDGAKDLARVLRVPGCPNLKPKYGKPSPIVSFHENTRLSRYCDWTDIEQLTAQIRKPKPSPKPTQQPQKAAHAGTGGHNARVRAFVNGAIKREIDELAAHPAGGGRNARLNQAAFALGGYLHTNVVTESELTEMLYQAAVINGSVAKRGEGQTRATIASGINSGKRNPRTVDTSQSPNLGGAAQMAQAATNAAHAGAAANGTSGSAGPAAAPQPQPAPQPQAAPVKPNVLHFDMSDEGNAKAVEALYPGRFAFNDAFGWMAWNGTHWDMDSSAGPRVKRAINDTLAERVTQAAQSGNMQAYGRLIAFCTANKGRVEGALYQLRSLSSVDVPDTEFDTQPDLLNTLSGVVDLRTKQIYPHDPSQRFTYCVPVHYRPGIDYTEWIELLKQWVPVEQLEELRLLAGYSATGLTREEILVYMVGPTRSGKGTYSETIGAVLGSKLAKEVEFATFTEKRTGDNQNFDLAPLKPCRVVFASESNEYERLNEAKVKALTGGNQIRCSFKHRDHFNYRPQFKIWLSSNHPVNADPDDDAVWGRLRIIQFPNSYLGKEDKTLKQRLLSPAMLEQVLAWIIDGAADWYQLGPQGIPETATGAMLKQQTRNSLDQLGQWLEDSCEVGPNYSEMNSALYTNYETWCKQNGVSAKKQKSFTVAMNKRGYHNPKTKTGRKWIGLRLAYTGIANQP